MRANLPAIRAGSYLAVAQTSSLRGADPVDQLVFQEMAARKIPGVSVAGD